MTPLAWEQSTLQYTTKSVLLTYFSKKKKRCTKGYLHEYCSAQHISELVDFLLWNSAPCTKVQYKKAHVQIKTLTFFTDCAILNKSLQRNIPENLYYVFCFKRVGIVTHVDVIQVNWKHTILYNNGNWSYKKVQLLMFYELQEHSYVVLCFISFHMTKR